MLTLSYCISLRLGHSKHELEINNFAMHKIDQLFSKQYSLPILYHYHHLTTEKIFYTSLGWFLLSIL